MGSMIHRLLAVAGILTLLGAGCISSKTQDVSPEQAAQALTFQIGDQFAIRETVFGIGGAFVRLLNGNEAERVVSLEQWQSGEKATLQWTRKYRAETKESIAAREAYKKQYANAPVGSTLPDEPKPIYEAVIEQGTLGSNSIAQGDLVLLPLFWNEETVSKQYSSLLWLSPKQYEELVTMRNTSINLGLFDTSISQVVGVTESVKAFIEKIQNGPEFQSETQDVQRVEADIKWINYPLMWNGKRIEVQAINAQNTFARYTILANPNNPLILEIALTPASRGSFNFFSPKGIRDGFWGYEVSFVKTKNSPMSSAQPSVDQPQPSDLKTPSDL